MGGSLRRSKRYRPKVTRSTKRQKQAKTKLPDEITAGRPDLKQKLNQEPDWDTLKNLGDNYTGSGFVGDPNSRFGRNAEVNGAGPDLEVEEWSDHEQVEPQDEDFRSALGLERLANKKPPPKLTSHQQRIVGALIQAHGEDVQAMVKDTKLNKMLLPASKLKRLIESYHAHRGAHGFRAPIKHNRHH